MEFLNLCKKYSEEIKIQSHKHFICMDSEMVLA